MKVLGLRAENVKVLKVVDITPDEHFQVVSGPNGAGKTSLVDSIFLALQGSKLLKKMDNPINHAADTAYVELDLGEIIVKRKITKSGTKLEARTREGSKINSPQELLDSLVGSLSFDPLEFANMKPKDQRETLLKLMNVDTTEIDKEIEEARERRKLVWHDKDSADSKVKGLMAFRANGEPEEVLTSSDIIRAIKHTNEGEKAANEQRSRLASLYKEFEEMEEAIAAKLQEIERLQSEVSIMKEKKAELEKDGSELAELVDELPDSDWFAEKSDSLQEKLTNLEQQNDEIRKRNEYRAAYEEFRKQDTAYAEADKAVKVLEKKKEDMLASLAFPVNGLGISDDGVTYRKTPDSEPDTLADISDGMRLKVSTAVAMAMNPTIRVIRINNASLLDKENLEAIRQMAVDKDYQVWAEMVDRQEIGINIEGGEVV